LIQLFKLAQILAESVCLCVCVCVSVLCPAEQQY